MPPPYSSCALSPQSLRFVLRESSPHSQGCGLVLDSFGGIKDAFLASCFAVVSLWSFSREVYLVLSPPDRFSYPWPHVHAENVGEASVCGKLMGLDGFASLFCFPFTPEGGGRSTPRPHTG